MPLSQEILARIQEEITIDSEKRGYAGKAPAEIVNLLNEPFYTIQIEKVVTKTKPIDSLSKDEIIEKLSSGVSIADLLKETVAENEVIYSELHLARISQILIGVANSPNFITEEDLVGIDSRLTI